MSKLPRDNIFFDVSDYGRPIARIIAYRLKNTSVTPVQITFWFIIVGLLGVFCMLNGLYIAAGILFIIKSILDAADGELSRVKNTPSYTGRYLDSLADIGLNLLIFITLYHITESSLIITFLSFFCMQLQGTLYNYYYVILRNKFKGDVTSRVFENKPPKAMKGECQKCVNRLFFLYTIAYGIFDRIIIFLDPKAPQGKTFPKYLMAGVSIFGLGFQLFIISFMLIAGWKNYIASFFILYSLLIFVFILARKIL